jgi:N-acetylmuramoyl-L-alanine amidase
MPKPNKVKGVVIHCTAGYGNVEAIKRYWKTLGWNSPGYCRIVDLDANIHTLADYVDITNGVKGFNSEYIHIAYTGGVDPNNYKKAVDTRTDKQKLKLQFLISDIMLWLEKNGEDITKDFAVVGHRDFSNDKNGSGVIEKFERIKECPSFDAIKEYLYYTSEDRKLKLP